jgi:hypothetical protein
MLRRPRLLFQSVHLAQNLQLSTTMRDCGPGRFARYPPGTIMGVREHLRILRSN